MASLMLLKSMLYMNAVRKTKTRKKVKLKKVSASSAPTPKNLDMKKCRICYVEVGDIPIFNNLILPNICEDIKNFSGVTISKSDRLPKHICQSCLDLLNGCVMFREMCQSTHKKIVELSIKKEVKDCDIANGQQGNNDNSANIFSILQMTNQENSDDDSYRVPSPVFSDKSDLWGCPECNKEFKDLKSYSSHLKDCNNKVINERPSLEQPKRNKNEIKTTFLCDICGKTSRSKASLAVHMGTHENIFPFKCDVCPYRGRTMDLLKVHQRSHLVDKPYKCSQCAKATTTASNLTKHMRHVHSTTRPYKCHYCDKAFSSQHDMKRHIKDIHLRQGTVECDICYKKFNTKKILQGHRYKIHKIKGERSGRLPSYLQCQVDGSAGTDTQAY